VDDNAPAARKSILDCKCGISAPSVPGMAPRSGWARSFPLKARIVPGKNVAQLQGGMDFHLGQKTGIGVRRRGWLDSVMYLPGAGCNLPRTSKAGGPGRLIWANPPGRGQGRRRAWFCRTGMETAAKPSYYSGGRNRSKMVASCQTASRYRPSEGQRADWDIGRGSRTICRTRASFSIDGRGLPEMLVINRRHNGGSWREPRRRIMARRRGLGDAPTGKLLWNFIRPPGQATSRKRKTGGRAAGKARRSGTNVWGIHDGGSRAGLVYLPIGGPTFRTCRRRDRPGYWSLW